MWHISHPRAEMNAITVPEESIHGTLSLKPFWNSLRINDYDLINVIIMRLFLGILEP